MGHRKAGFRSLYDWFKAAGCASRKTVLGPGGSPQEAGDKAIKPEPTKLEVSRMKPRRFHLYVHDKEGDAGGYVKVAEVSGQMSGILEAYQTYFSKLGVNSLRMAEEDKAALEALKTLRRWLQTVN